MKKRSSAGAAEPSLKWTYFNQMLFLRDIVEPRMTTSNIKLDVENENSVQEALQGYEEELEDSASQILSAIVDGRGDDCPAHSASSPPTHSPHVLPTLPSQYASLRPQASASAPCRSLPSPQSVSAAFADPASPNTLSDTSQPPRRHFACSTVEVQLSQIPHIPGHVGKVPRQCSRHLHWWLNKQFAPLAALPLTSRIYKVCVSSCAVCILSCVLLHQKIVENAECLHKVLGILWALP
ncbi:uncharacterized protein ISCGN_017754 [Ixodes scapularis]